VRLLLWHLGREDLQGQSGKVTGCDPWHFVVEKLVKPGKIWRKNPGSHPGNTFSDLFFGICLAFWGRCGYVLKKKQPSGNSTYPNVQ